MKPRLSEHFNYTVHVDPCMYVYVKGLSALDLDSIHFSVTPQTLHTKLDYNWINPLQSCPHYELNSCRFVHKAQLWSRVGILLLAVKQSCFWISRPAGFGHCLLLIHTTTCSFFVQSDTQHLLQTCASINKYDCHMDTSFPVIIHFRSKANPPTKGGLARSQSDRHKSA